MGFIEDKAKMVQLSYTFVFNRRDNIWNHITDFEHDLMNFFKDKGLEAQQVTFIDGSGGNRMLYIRDTSKDMTLRNDKNLTPQTLPQAKPSSSYTTTKHLVARMNKGGR